jgi:hypothetical protein
MEDRKGTNDEDDESQDMEGQSKESWPKGVEQEEERMVSVIFFGERK